MNPLAAAFAKYHADGTVAEVEPVTRSMLRIRVVPNEPVTLPYTPGQHVRIQIRDPLSLYGILRPIETLRTYTIWDYTPDAFELRVHLYDGDGIGLRWARMVAAGEPVTFWGPQGDFRTRPAPYHVFVGEETATAAFGPMIKALGAGERIYGVLESASAADELAILGGLQRVRRNGSPAASSRVLLEALAELELPAEPGVAYVAGEARTCQAVRHHFVHDRGWPRKAIITKPFWTPGKRGLH